MAPAGPRENPFERSPSRFRSAGPRVTSKETGRETAEIRIRVIPGCARTKDACRSVSSRVDAPGTAESERGRLS